MKRILSYIFGALMLFSAYGHFANPEFYSAMIPSFIPETFANILAGVVEFIIGVGFFIPKYRSLAGLGFFALMIAFLPIHIWDLFKEVPAIGSFQGAIIRLVIQFVLIYAGWWIWKGGKEKSTA